MRTSNKLVREWLLQKGYNEIWFKTHSKKNDYVFTQKGSYMAQDLWNLFDGICFSGQDTIVFLQMKTNSWAAEKPIKAFVKKTGLLVISFNVTNKLKECNGHYKVFVRYYS